MWKPSREVCKVACKAGEFAESETLLFFQDCWGRYFLCNVPSLKKTDLEIHLENYSSSTQRLGTSNSKERDTFLLHSLCRQSSRVVRSFLAFWAWCVLVLSRKWISKDIKKQASSRTLSDPILRECMISLSYWKKTQTNGNRKIRIWMTEWFFMVVSPTDLQLVAVSETNNRRSCLSQQLKYWPLDAGPCNWQNQHNAKVMQTWLSLTKPSKNLHKPSHLHKTCVQNRNVKTFAEAQHSPVRSPRAAQPPLEEHAAELEGSKGNGAVAPPKATSCEVEKRYYLKYSRVQYICMMPLYISWLFCLPKENGMSKTGFYMSIYERTSQT